MAGLAFSSRSIYYQHPESDTYTFCIIPKYQNQEPVPPKDNTSGSHQNQKRKSVSVTDLFLERFLIHSGMPFFFF